MAFLIPDKIEVTPQGLTIKEYFLNAHNTNKISMPAKRQKNLIGVTLHNTDDIKEAAGTTDSEQYTRATINGNMGEARVHYYVDAKEAWRNLSDDYTSWHSATGGNGPGNSDTISIECIMSGKQTATDKTSMENAAKLIAYIFNKYGWTVDKNLYTHNYWTNWLATGKMLADHDTQSLAKVSTLTNKYDGTGKANPAGKYCPVYILPQWNAFKNLITQHQIGVSISVISTPAPSPSKFEPYLVIIAVDSLNYRKGPGSNYSVAGRVRRNEVYTIVEEATGSGASKWGKLKSGAGWISLDFIKRR